MRTVLTVPSPPPLAADPAQSLAPRWGWAQCASHLLVTPRCGLSFVQALVSCEDSFWVTDLSPAQKYASCHVPVIVSYMCVTYALLQLSTVGAKRVPVVSSHLQKPWIRDGSGGVGALCTEASGSMAHTSDTSVCKSTVPFQKVRTWFGNKNSGLHCIKRAQQAHNWHTS